MPARKYKVGDIFNKLTIVEIIPGKRKVKCLCECYNEKWIDIRDVVNKRITGCGCSRNNEEKRKQASDKMKQLHKERPETFKNKKRNTTDEERSFKYLLKLINNKCKKTISRKYRAVDIEDIKTVWKKQNGACAYSNIKLKLPLPNVKMTPYEQASIDRIDSSKTYTKDNIQFVSVTCNFAKNTLSDKDMKIFIEIIKNNGSLPNTNENDLLIYNG